MRNTTAGSRAWVCSVCFCATLAACASSQAPPELIDARVAYARAKAGPAPALTPDALREADAAMSRAEKAFADSAKEREVRTLAYIAERKAELADVQAHSALNARQQQQAEQDVEQATRELGKKDGEEDVAAREKELERAKQERAESERRAEEIRSRLTSILSSSAVKDDARGTVIVLTGRFLFPAGKTTLLPAARQKLNQVAELLKGDRHERVAVESRVEGSGDKIELAAQERADAVRDYLVLRGVADGRILAKTVSSSSSASDDSPRANRGVEIVIERAVATE